jgi:pantothenate kinase type III
MEKAKKNILFLGSTNRRIGFFQGDKLISVKKSQSSEKDLADIATDLKDETSAATLCVNVRSDLKEGLKSFQSVVPNAQLFDPDKACKNFSLTGFYKDCGHDRLANLIGAIELFPANNIVILDFGTCITLTQIKYVSIIDSKTETQIGQRTSLHSSSKNGFQANHKYEYVKGFILPGISSLLSLPSQHANGLPIITEMEFIEHCLNWKPAVSAKSPKVSIMEGIIKTVTLLVQEAFNGFHSPFDLDPPAIKDCKVILTGGWAVTVQSLQNKLGVSKNRTTIEPNLGLIGGRRYLEELE